MEAWSDGILLIGRYWDLQTGCWLLSHGKEAAVVEMPPFSDGETPPWEDAAREAEAQDASVRFLLCTHCHGDHIQRETLKGFLDRFPQAVAVLQKGFAKAMGRKKRIRYFDAEAELALDGEPLWLIHAPKHSLTDTMIVFRGAVIAGDWELNTIRSVHDDKGAHAVPLEKKLASIERMKAFQRDRGYRIHRVFAVHANDRRLDVDFDALMEDTKEDRKFW